MATDDEAIHQQVLREVLLAASEMDRRETPPAMSQRMHRLIRRLSGVADPYEAIKAHYTEMALAMYPDLKARVEQSADPLAAAVRLAIAGNVIDFGPPGELDEGEVRTAVAEALEAPLVGDLSAFAAAVEAARDILYLADNAGEIVFDRLLLDRLPTEKVAVVVKGAAVINDATLADAEAAGLTGPVEVIDNGSDAPGTILADCSDAFRRRFDRADLIIAKGQGNYETLSEVDKAIFFILKAKCRVIARDLGCEVGAPVLRASAHRRQADPQTAETLKGGDENATW